MNQKFLAAAMAFCCLFLCAYAMKCSAKKSDPNNPQRGGCQKTINEQLDWPCHVILPGHPHRQCPNMVCASCHDRSTYTSDRYCYPTCFKHKKQFLNIPPSKIEEHVKKICPTCRVTRKRERAEKRKRKAKKGGRRLGFSSLQRLIRESLRC